VVEVVCASARARSIATKKALKEAPRGLSGDMFRRVDVA